ncbi:MAG: hypothetical protein H0U08_07705 [Actinobacteria bacterium]|nr:hypothetical protein [Actinomycetota bacterium]
MTKAGEAGAGRATTSGSGDALEEDSDRAASNAAATAKKINAPTAARAPRADLRPDPGINR